MEASAYREETVAIYVEDFRPKVIYVRNRFSERELVNPDLDRYYEHPINPLGIEALATALDELAARARKQNHDNDI
jgi:hypothetical protein